ncbi:MAG: type II toxin-antitoxin system RelE/ParE family toxin [Campylobacterota bacterium]|nr:type II toxin-antitoxin system RelE/ParE family toxin [Campylobacterota bacterium]
MDALQHIISFIALDSVNRAHFFKKQLDTKIANLTCFPYKYRQSIHHTNKDVRDLIYKGYTIVYRVSVQKETIEIIDIFKWTK